MRAEPSLTLHKWPEDALQARLFLVGLARALSSPRLTQRTLVLSKAFSAAEVLQLEVSACSLALPSMSWT